MRKAKFYLDCLEGAKWDGYTNGDTWNGFACPFFTHSEGLRLHAALLALRDALDLDTEELDVDWKPEDFSSTQIDDVTVYAIGSYEWTWEELEINE